MDELLQALKLDIYTLQIEADFAFEQPHSRELQQRFAELYEQVDHRIELVAGLLQQEEAPKEAKAS